MVEGMFGMKDVSTSHNVGSKEETDHDHGRSCRIESQDQLIDGFTQASQSEVGQVSPKGPTSKVPKPIADDPVNDGMLVFHQRPSPSVKRGSKDLQGVIWVCKNPEEVYPSR